ncbi:MAG TPA: hypothetical protein VH476_08665 [Solirubrobacterales bacterium]
MDPLLRELRAAVEASEFAQLALYALIDGHLVVGELCSPSLFTEDSNNLVKTRITEAEEGKGPPAATGDQLRSLLIEHPDGEPDERYLTLRWASVVSLRDEVVELPVLRVDTESISAWWLREWSLPPQRRSASN